MSVNRVWLIGHIAALPRQSADFALLLVATVRSGHAGDVVDRHLVRCPVADVVDLSTGALVLVEGRLGLDEGRRRHVVVAETVALLLAPRAPGARATPAAVHSSPTPHERTGHFRRLGIGTAQERLVWVRPASVGRSRQLI
jgi:hypothetical protein